jgi:hypothetical protein
MADDVKLWHPDLGDAGWVCVRSSHLWGSAEDRPEQVFLVAHVTAAHSELAARLLSRWSVGANRFECTTEDALGLLRHGGFQEVE